MADAGITSSWRSIRMPGSDPVEEAQPEVDPQPRGTFIESGAAFEGTLRLQGDFRIDSDFRGELCTDGVVVIGPYGSVEGDIKARQVEIQGAVVGNVTARRLFILRASGRLHGDVETACVEIERHAVFQGNSRMTRPQSSSTAHTAEANAAP